ncbi:hypothetical protein NAC44_05710 [Allorhizobium sp. BGMRC 0089]|uniref:hypothetical protein n=1 Tax=Allorhizobium sonneratiae TaxID=2934936 RepID=UPI0020342235|nr:hypothetical protein [Allorhizobium sonneratiae]MCM2291821.1 hypothetical protein [Allorhizobium sonneratiae]
MSKTPILALLLMTLPGLAFAESMTPAQIEKTLKDNNMSAMIPLYQSGALVLDEKNTTVNIMRLNSPDGAYEESAAADAQYWYRGMPAQEANSFVANGSVAVEWQENSYIGIAPQYSYSKDYLKAKNPGAVIEFKTAAAQWLYDQWSVQHSCTIKAEGGGTYGLGYKGSTQSCNKGKNAFKPPIQGLGAIFNPWLQDHTVTSNVVYVLGKR